MAIVRIHKNPGRVWSPNCSYVVPQLRWPPVLWPISVLQVQLDHFNDFISQISDSKKTCLSFLSSHSSVVWFAWQMKTHLIKVCEPSDKTAKTHILKINSANVWQNQNRLFIRQECSPFLKVQLRYLTAALRLLQHTCINIPPSCLTLQLRSRYFTRYVIRFDYF